MKEDGGVVLDASVEHQGVHGAGGEQGLGVPHGPPHLPGLSHWRPW